MFVSIAIRIIFLILSLSLLLGGRQVHCVYFNFSNITESYFRDHILPDHDSNFALGAIQVTYDVTGAPITNLVGRALFKRRFKLWKDAGLVIASFNTSFVLNIKNTTTHGGEGLAFILTQYTTVPTSSHGQWLGIVNQQTNGSSKAPIIAIEFDTRKSYEHDLDDNHVGLDINTVYSRRQVSLTSFGVDLSSGKDVQVAIQYDGKSKNLSLYVGEMRDLVFTENIDLSTYLPEKVFVGFSASTSNETQLNCVKTWEFEGSDIDNENLKWIRVFVPVIGVFLLVSIGFAIYWKRKIDREKMEDAYPSIEEAIQGSSTAPRKFKWKELNKATGSFSPKNKLGKGGFGTVYKGVMRNKEVAVKKFSEKSTQGKTEFIAEVTTIGNLHHRNLVKLIGWCYEKRQFLLVYEYLPNRSLDRFIFVDQKSSESSELSTLNWVTRQNVVLGAAHALDYLHNGCQDTVLHRDIKSSNIMLDSDFSAKLGDFGLARTMKLSDQTHHSTKEIAGTPGYMAPESILTGRFTVETDVYAFGVLILEVACGRRPGGQNHENDYNCNIVNWVWEFHRKGSIVNAADCRLNGEFEEFDMECVLVLGLACCHPNPNKRPSMKNVLQVLKGEAPPPEVPTERPAFMWPPLPPSFKELDISLGQITPFSQLSGR
ncbi:probable L-type lectin-domain containing receptor kinase S.5 [Euphorbia lathyris]|uniref:probable L-type lectin-domain containing receptor kinase S.5 n=1 Tax=Euphorbia lathyris TaxID=212925 RepID=UPI003313106C